MLVMLAANQMNEQPFENTFVPWDQDLGHWSSLKKKNAYGRHYECENSPKAEYKIINKRTSELLVPSQYDHIKEEQIF